MEPPAYMDRQLGAVREQRTLKKVYAQPSDGIPHPVHNGALALKSFAPTIKQEIYYGTYQQTTLLL